MPLPGALNWSWPAEAAKMPPVTLDMYAGIPEEFARTIEDGSCSLSAMMAPRCRSSGCG